MSQSPNGASLRQTATELVRVLPALNRALDRRADRDFPFPKPPESQMAMLTLVQKRDGITVREAAEMLLLRPNNASTLVSQMVAAGLLRREQDLVDRRVAHLHVTADTRTRIRDVDELYCSYVITGLDLLDTEERATLARALPALRALARNVHPTIH